MYSLYCTQGQDTLVNLKLIQVLQQTILYNLRFYVIIQKPLIILWIDGKPNNLVCLFQIIELC